MTWMVLLGLAKLSAAGVAFASVTNDFLSDYATGTYRVRQITRRERGEKDLPLCGTKVPAGEEPESRIKDCDKQVAVYRKGAQVALVELPEKDATYASSFLMYANPFRKQHCKGWIPLNYTARDLFAGQFCRALRFQDPKEKADLERDSFIFHSDIDYEKYLAESQYYTFLLLGMPMGMTMHQRIWLPKPSTQEIETGHFASPKAFVVRDRIDARLFGIGIGINYDYELVRVSKSP